MKYSSLFFCIFRGFQPVGTSTYVGVSRGFGNLTQHHLTLRVLRLRCWKMMFEKGNLDFIGAPKYLAAYRTLFPFWRHKVYNIVLCPLYGCGNGTKLSQKKEKHL